VNSSAEARQGPNSSSAGTRRYETFGHRQQGYAAGDALILPKDPAIAECCPVRRLKRTFGAKDSPFHRGIVTRSSDARILSRGKHLRMLPVGSVSAQNQLKDMDCAQDE
jgi:hypothetical protein